MEGSELIINITYEDVEEGRDGDTHAQRESGIIKWRWRIEWISTGKFMRTAVALKSWRLQEGCSLTHFR